MGDGEKPKKHKPRLKVVYKDGLGHTLEQLWARATSQSSIHLIVGWMYCPTCKKFIKRPATNDTIEVVLK